MSTVEEVARRLDEYLAAFCDQCGAECELPVRTSVSRETLDHIARFFLRREWEALERAAEKCIEVNGCIRCANTLQSLAEELRKCEGRP